MENRGSAHEGRRASGDTVHNQQRANRERQRMRSREQTARSMAKGSGRTKQKRSNRTKRDDAERPRIRLVVDVRGDKVTAGVVVDDGRITDRVRQLNGTKAVNAMNEKAKDQREGEDRKIATDALGLSPLELTAILNCLTPEAVPMFGRASPLIVRRDKVLSVGRVRDETVGTVGLGSDRARARKAGSEGGDGSPEG